MLNKIDDWFESWGFSLFFIGIFLLFVFVPFCTYHSLGYTGDGFHIYSALRNTISYKRLFFEGPTYGYILGTHAYLSALLLVPLLQFFKTPLVLAYVAPFCHILGTWLFFRILCSLDTKKKARGFITAFSVLYFFYPSTFENMATYNLFQIDVLLEPFMLFGFYSFLRGHVVISAIFGLLILLLKEEYIPLYPLLFLFTAYCAHHQNSEFATRQGWIRITLWAVAIGIMGSTLSYLTLEHYRGMNEFNAGLRSLEFKLPYPWLILKNIGLLLKPIVAVLILAFIYKLKSRRIALGWALLFLFYRCLLHILAYQKIYVYHWSNTMLTPSLFLSVGVFLVPSIGQLKKSQHRTLWTACLLTFLLCFPEVRHTGTFGLISNTLKLRSWNVIEARELKELRSKIKPPVGYEYFIGPEYTFAPFMDRSHLSLGHLMQDTAIVDVSRRRPLFQNSSFVILPKSNYKNAALYRLPEATKIVKESHTLILETDNFFLYAKPGTSG